jgi:hypothetical protein
MNKSELGSYTAKGGFANEKAICEKFISWKNDNEARQWLEIMGYNINKIKTINAIQIPVKIKKNDLKKYEIYDEKDYENFIKYKKADIQIKIIIKLLDIIKVENISLKKANSDANYNQIDKRSIYIFQKMWNFDEDVAFWLKLFTGEYNPKNYLNKININNLRDERRLYIDEMPLEIQNKIINFFNENKIMIVNDIIKGRGGLSADWMLVTKYNKETDETSWILKDINVAMNFFGLGAVSISPKGSLYIGKITMQRKGGTPDPTKLQFKIKPCQLFELGV